jgi:hypothetical protein
VVVNIDLDKTKSVCVVTIQQFPTKLGSYKVKEEISQLPKQGRFSNLLVCAVYLIDPFYLNTSLSSQIQSCKSVFPPRSSMPHLFSWTTGVFFLLFTIPGFELRVSHSLGRCSTLEPLLQLSFTSVLGRFMLDF